MSTTYHHPDLRELILRETRELIEAEGVDAANIASIASRCGVSVAAPYRHFADKSELLAGVAREGFLDLERELRDVSAGADSTREVLLRLGCAYVHFAIEHPNLFRLMFSRDLRGELPPESMASLSILARALDPADVRVDPEIALRAAWAFVHGLALLRASGVMPPEPDETRRRAELEALLDGILS